MDTKTNVIYFKKCKTMQIDNHNLMNIVKKKIKKSNKFYLLIEPDNSILQNEVFNLLCKENIKTTIIYNNSKKNESKKNFNKGNVYCAKIEKENIENIICIIQFVINNIDDNKNISIILVRNEKGLIEIDFKHAEMIININYYTNKKNIFISMILLIIISIFILTKMYVIVIPKRNSEKIGIIDGKYTLEYDNVVYNISSDESLEEQTHGDKILDFAEKISNGLNIYYYDASNQDGIINTENILKGLNYMKNNDVKKINLSISSKKYSADIQKWINDNTDIEIYASYNNLINSKDYPAMYENVYGCGKKVDIKFKDSDYIYSSNKIIIFPNIFQTYKGNSYLSIYNTITR